MNDDSKGWPRKFVALRLETPLTLIVDHEYPEGASPEYVYEERECFAPNITGRIVAAVSDDGDEDPHGICRVLAVVPHPGGEFSPCSGDEALALVKQHAPEALRPPPTREAEALALLREVEWKVPVNEGDWHLDAVDTGCPCCKRPKWDGHAPDCRLALLLGRT